MISYLFIPVSGPLEVGEVYPEDTYSFTRTKMDGGYLEAVRFGDRHHGYIDEEGKLKNLPVNFMATTLWARTNGWGEHPHDVLCGPVLIFGSRDSEGLQDGEEHSFIPEDFADFLPHPQQENDMTFDPTTETEKKEEKFPRLVSDIDEIMPELYAKLGIDPEDKHARRDTHEGREEGLDLMLRIVVAACEQIRTRWEGDHILDAGLLASLVSKIGDMMSDLVADEYTREERLELFRQEFMKFGVPGAAVTIVRL